MAEKNSPQSRSIFARIGSWGRSIGYFLTMGIFGLVTSSLGPVLPDLARQVSVSLDMVGVIFTARAFGFLFGSLLGGRVYDKHKGHPFFTIAFLALSILTIFLPMNNSFWLLVGMVFGQGLCLGLIVVGASTFIVWEHTENPGPWLSVQSFINGMGGFFSPLIINYAYSRFGGYTQSFWIYALLACIMSAYFFFLNSPKIRTEKKKEEGGIEMPVWLIYLMALIYLLYVGAEGSYNGWIYSVATVAYTLPETDARLLNSLFWGGMAIARLSGVVVSGKVRSDILIIISFVGSAASILFTILFPQSETILWIANIGTGIFMALIFPTLMMYTEKQMQLTGKKAGIFFAATSIGGMLMPWLSGQVFARVNPRAVMVVIFVSILIGVFVFLYVREKMRKIKKSSAY